MRDAQSPWLLEMFQNETQQPVYLITVYCKSLKSLHIINGKVTLLEHLLDEIQNKDNALILYGIIEKNKKRNKENFFFFQFYIFPENSWAWVSVILRSLPCPGPHSWETGTLSLRGKAVTFFINETHTLYLQKCSSADSTKPLSCTG